MALIDLFSDRNEKAAADATKAGIATAKTDLSGGMDALRTNYGRASAAYDPYAAAGGKAVGTYSDALGLNGAAGNDAATAAFRAGPGYDFALNQGLQALQRTASSRGALGGGGLSADILDYATGTADKSYGSWLDRLNGLTGTGLQAASGQAGVATGLGGAEYGYGSDVANLDTGAAKADATYEAGKDATGANILGAVTGGLSLGAKLLGIGGFGPGTAAPAAYKPPTGPTYLGYGVG